MIFTASLTARKTVRRILDVPGVTYTERATGFGTSVFHAEIADGSLKASVRLTLAARGVKIDG